MQVAKWGNSLAIRIPASVAEALDLKEGDDITTEGREKIVDVVSRFLPQKADKNVLLNRLKEHNARPENAAKPLPGSQVFEK